MTGQQPLSKDYATLVANELHPSQITKHFRKVFVPSLDQHGVLIYAKCQTVCHCSYSTLIDIWSKYGWAIPF